MVALSTWTPDDVVLSVVAPLGLAAAAGTALVVDLDPAGPRLGGSTSLADLVAGGPRRSDLAPHRKGVAVLPNGGVEADAARDILEALAIGWPAVVFRMPREVQPSHWRDVVPVRLLVPPEMLGVAAIRASNSETALQTTVYQRSVWHVAQPGPGPVMPRPRRSTVAALLAGRRPGRDRWVGSWRRVWDQRWA